MYVCMLYLKYRGGNKGGGVSFRRGTPKMTFTNATPTGMYVCMYKYICFE